MSHFTGKITSLRATRGEDGKSRLDFMLGLDGGGMMFISTSSRAWAKIAAESLTRPEDDPLVLKGTIAEHASKACDRGMSKASPLRKSLLRDV